MSPANTDTYELTLNPGLELGNFTILKVLGQGGFGITYLAYDRILQTEVVIKENMPTTFAGRSAESHRVVPLANTTEDFEWATERFLTEAETLHKLQHRNIVRVTRVFRALDTAYFVMPYVGGMSLDKVLREEGPLPEKRLRPLLCSLLDALQYLHSKDLLHRDIKPANILLDEEGEPILIDFGAARQLSQYSQTVMESPGYTPFEQMKTRGNVGPWSDLYALGGTMYKLITGDAPIRSTDRVEEDTQPKLANNPELRYKYTLSFLQSIDKALAASIGERWQNADEWIYALNREESPTSTPDQAGPTQAGEQYTLGLSYQYGLHGNQNNVEAAKWIKKAAEQGHTMAQYSMALLYKQGRGVEQSPQRAFEWIEKANEPNLTPNNVAAYQQAIEWIRSAAERGDADAQFILGSSYSDGLGVIKDDHWAELWYRKAAEQGHAWGQCALGIMYQIGLGGKKDDHLAALWFNQAAAQGDALGELLLGDVYSKGLGVEQNDQWAFYWYNSSASQGIPLAQLNIGYMYAEGRGVEKNDRAAAGWIYKAAEQGLADAQLALGHMYASGQGIAKDDRKAAVWIQKAAKQGLADAQLALGHMYASGQGVAKDDRKAAVWIQKAVKQGLADAQLALGHMYASGQGIAKDDRKAAVWIQKAAKQGLADAQNALGVLYTEGRGVAQDTEKAAAWFRKAAAQGHPSAQENLQILEKEKQSGPKPPPAQKKPEEKSWPERGQKFGLIVGAMIGLISGAVGGGIDGAIMGGAEDGGPLLAIIRFLFFGLIAGIGGCLGGALGGYLLGGYIGLAIGIIKFIIKVSIKILNWLGAK